MPTLLFVFKPQHADWNSLMIILIRSLLINKCTSQMLGFVVSFICTVLWSMSHLLCFWLYHFTLFVNCVVHCNRTNMPHVWLWLTIWLLQQCGYEETASIGIRKLLFNRPDSLHERT